jgi:uncharacterized protein YjdB
MRYLLLVFVCMGLSVASYAQKIYAPNTTNSLTGGATYCQNVVPGLLTYTYNTCSSGTGTATGTALTISWYSNTINSTSGGTLQSTTFVSSSTSATGNTTFLPPTVDVGTMYYYCVITWDGTGLCNTSGSLTSPVATVVVNTAPDVISGSLSGCVGTLTTLSNTVGGGTWSSSAATKASVNSSTGVVNAIAAGTATISYSIGSCRSTAVFTVNSNPSAISGTQTVCQNAVTTFTDATAGGTWSTGDASIATINASSPVGITGVNAGTTNITYTLSSSGCYATRPVTVNVAPGAITGTFTACVGTLTTLSNAVGGGTWASSASTKASVNSSTGVVNAIAAGTATISYTIGSCRSTAGFTVNVNPSAVTGTNTICQNATTSFSDATAGGTWSTADASIASINASSPVTITGLNAGTTNITYTLTSSGCYATRPITVNTQPAAITGTAVACVGFQTTLADATPGGTWTSTTTTKATITAAGVVSAVASGTSTISYTLGSCRSTVVYTVNANPAAITGTQTVCKGATVTFADATVGGTWSSANSSVATLTPASPGVVTGVDAGNTTISYTLGTGCYATRTVTVNTSPDVITGTFSSCTGVQTTLSNTVGGGVWSSSASTKASVNSSTGVVNAIAAGTATISYTIGTCRSTAVFTVNSTPAVITGTNVICQGAVTTFSNTVAGGTWSTTDATVASIDASTPVLITGVNAGNATISYTIGSCFSTRGITVNTAPAAITGAYSACVGTLATLSNSVAGGTWSSSATTKASVNSSGVVNAISAGSATISYTIGSCRSTAAFTVNSNPNAIGGFFTVCKGSVSTLTNATAGGAWSSSDESLATVESGLYTGVNSGSPTISYTLPTGCFATRVVTVNNTPDPISGPSTVCRTSSISLTDATPSGSWSSSSMAVASVNASTGVVTGVSVGSATITYVLGSCKAVLPITVLASPVSITGSTSNVCEGAQISFSNATPGGSWSSDNAAVASIEAGTGVVTGVGFGTTTITYSTGCGSPVSQSVTVDRTPTDFTGTPAVCVAAVAVIGNGDAGGTWSGGAPEVATIDASGNIYGVATGSTNITYTLGSCAASRSVTVNPNPESISGSSLVCTETPVTFTDATVGGVWSSSDNSKATVDASSGVVAGLGAGSVNISYTVSYSVGSCSVAYPTTVNSLPARPEDISGTPVTFCTGTVVTLSDATAAGTWSSATPSVATIDESGAVTGLSGGTSTISYSLTNECGTVAATQDVTVVDYPFAFISSAPNACYNYATNIVFEGTPSATITYKVDGGADQTAILAGGSISVSSGVITSAHNYELVEVHNATCATEYHTTATISTIPMQWVGGVSSHETEWTNVGNWSCGFVPGDTTDVTIPSGAGYYPVISGDIVGAKRLTIASGAQMSIGGSSQLIVKSSLSNSGAITGDGALIMSGSTPQTITGLGRVNNLIVNNAAGVTINTGARVIVTKELSMAAGNLATNDSLVLYSDSTINARINAIPLGSAITGNVKVMQYVRGGYRRYRFWAHPFSSAISLSQIQSYIDITGTGGSANGFTTTASNNASCFRYDPLLGNSSLGSDPGWRPYTKINGAAADSNLFHSGQGIRLFIRGTKGQGLGFVNETPNPVTISMVGPINQGDQTIVLSRGATTLQDYNMLGNPFPAPIDLGTIMYTAKATGSIVGSAFYVWDPYLGAGGQYIAVPIGSGAPTPYYLQANCAFQVRAAHNGDVITFSEGNKYSRADSVLLRPASEYITLKVVDRNEHMWDELRVKFNDNATADEDNDYDAHKLEGPDFNFYTVSADAQKLAIDARPFDDDITIPVGISSAYAQQFTIRASEVVAPAGKTVYLHDKLLNKYVQLEAGSEYQFSVSAEAATQGNDRFEISAKAGTSETSRQSTVVLAPNPATDIVNIMFTSATEEEVSVRVLDVSGVSVYTSDLGKVSTVTTAIPLKSLAAGIYMVEVSHGTQKFVKRLVKE